MSKRQETEHNAMELVIPMLLVFSCIHTYNDMLKEIEKIKNDKSYYENKIKFNGPEDFEEYVKDFERKNKKDFIVKKKYIENFRKEQKQFPIFNTENIEYILVSGKKNKHYEIEELNKDILDKRECKSDIYIKQKTGETIGFSIKQQVDAPKSNYTVEGILSTINPEYSVLKDIRLKYLSDNGYKIFNETERPYVNRLFYPQSEPNPYWCEMRKYIHDNNNAVMQKILEPLFCKNIKNYDIYEFDGKKF
jgi:5'-deoxynucleotidase YfbR-like HD superfamily hydrolase